MTEHAEPQTEELKKHGDPLDGVEESVGGKSSKEQDKDNDSRNAESKE